MKKMMAAYWYQEGLDIYSYMEGKPVRYASGKMESLQPVKRSLGVKILIVGRGQLMHLRKRYPPAPKEKLVKAVSLEMGEIFPISNPGFYCQIFRSISNYVELDIWAWETNHYEKIKEVFPFSHVIPEDVLFTADDPEVRLFQYRGMVSMLAHTKGRFLDSASIPLAGLDEEQVNRFLFNLRQVGEEIKRIRIYGLPQFQMKGAPGLELVRNEEKIYPPSMEELSHVDLKEFKIKGLYFPLPIPEPLLVMRIFLYLVLGYGLMLFLTMSNYDNAVIDIRKRIAGMDKKTVTQVAASQSAMDYTDVVQDVNAKLQKGLVPLKTMNMLAQKLPEGSFISRIMLMENNMELSISSKDPLALVKSLGSSDMVKKVMIKGAPNRDRSSGIYTFVVTLELIK